MPGENELSELVLDSQEILYSVISIRLKEMRGFLI